MQDNVLMPEPGNDSSDHKSSSQSLPASLRHEFEIRFQQDFSEVRIHESHQATLVGAKAYTQGTDIYFAPNNYQPFTQSGSDLIGHELAHVVQKRAPKKIEVPKGMVKVNKSENSRE